MIKGVIFDWDGVVVDSSHLHEKSWELLALEEKKVLPDDHFVKGFGMKNERVIPEVLGWEVSSEKLTELSLRKEALYRELIDEEGLPLLPGVEEFIAYLNELSIPKVIGSSTHLLNITKVLDQLNLSHVFTDIVCGDDVVNGKPAPDIFLKAAEKLGLSSEYCLVVEDALVGIEAAKKANMMVAAVTTTCDRDQLLHADCVVDRLDQIDIQVF